MARLTPSEHREKTNKFRNKRTISPNKGESLEHLTKRTGKRGENEYGLPKKHAKGRSNHVEQVIQLKNKIPTWYPNRKQESNATDIIS